MGGGLLQQNLQKKKKMRKKNKKIATAVFNEATKGYGDKTNVEILARYYCCTKDDIIDIISKLSVENRIDISNSLVNEKIAEKSLILLEKELQKEAMNNSQFEENVKKLKKNFENKTNLIEKIKNMNELSVFEIAGFYRALFN
jgi:hypothetical protein